MDAVLTAIAAKSVFVLGAACILSVAARRQSAATQHLIWTGAAFALLLLPLFSVSLPPLHFAAADKVFAPSVTFIADAPAILPAPTERAGSKPGPSRPRSPVSHWDWAIIAAFVWGFGALIGLTRLLFAWATLARLRARSKPAIVPEQGALSNLLGLGHHVDFLETPPGTMPMTFGCLRPVIFLPQDAPIWTSERRRAVILHELAHVRRADVQTQLFARIAFSLYWWNPLAWIGSRQFFRLRERAADDLVLEAGTRASDYAAHLLDVARLNAPAHTAAGIAMVQRSQLESRIAAILDSTIRRKAPGRLAIALAVLAGIAVLAPIAAIRAQTNALPVDVDATIRAATAQHNFKMLDDLADRFIKIRQYAIAKQLLEAALNIGKDVGGEQSSVYSDGLVRLGDFAWDHGGQFWMRPVTYYEQAAAIGDRPGTARALMRLGILNFSDAAKAEEYLNRSQAVDSRGKLLGETLAWMGALRQAQGKTAEAQSYFVQAQGAVVAGSPEQALVDEMYASFLRAQKRTAEAKSVQTAADKSRVEDVSSLSPKVSDASNAVRIGGDVKPPALVTKVEPSYSLEARAFKKTGTEMLRVIIDVNGRAGNITLVHGVGFGLDEQAVDAVSQWRFNPGTRNGTPVPVIAMIQVNFRLL